MDAAKEDVPSSFLSLGLWIEPYNSSNSVVRVMVIFRHAVISFIWYFQL